MVFIGYSLDSSRRAVALAEALDGCYATVGIHPQDAQSSDPAAWDAVGDLASASSRVVAIGEVGLDYYEDKVPREVQAAGFRSQLALARDLDLPVVIHSRDAPEDTMGILAEVSGGLTAILHCFMGSVAVAKEAWARGYYIGASGPVTYRSNDWLRAILREAPRDRVLIETDAPYLAPGPNRRRRSEPGDLPITAAALAAVWDVSPEEVGRLTAANARRLYRLPAP
jgi:TatD DNase family protein